MNSHPNHPRQRRHNCGLRPVKSLTAIASAAMLGLCPFAAHATSLSIANFSFESPAVSPTNTGVTLLYPSMPPGWTLESGNAYLKLFGSVYLTPADGNQTLHADLNPPPNQFKTFTLSQTLSDTTVAGKDYTLSLFAATSLGQPEFFEQLQFNGVTVASLTNTLTNPSLVQFMAPTVTATTSGETIKILFGAVETGDPAGQGAYFDNVQLIAVPEPAAGGFVLVSGVPLFVICRRRSRARSGHVVPETRS